MLFVLTWKALFVSALVEWNWFRIFLFRGGSGSVVNVIEFRVMN